MKIDKSLVAIVDDDPGVCRALARVVRLLGFETTIYGSGEEFLEGAMSTPPDHVLLDLHLPGIRGADLFRALRERQVSTRVVVMTGLDRPGAREKCLEAGAVAYITKPVQRSDLAMLFRPGAERDDEADG